MKATIVLDKKAEEELLELSKMEKTSKSEVVRVALNELYLKEKRAQENLLFFVDLYMKGVLTKDVLFLLLPQKDAEAVIIGTETGKEAAALANKISS